MKTLPRRTFLAGCGAALVAAPAPGGATKARFTLGIGTYTYHSLSIDEMIEHLVAIQVRRIELSSPDYFLPSLKMESIPVLKAKLDRAKITVDSYFCGSINNESDLNRTVLAAKGLGSSHVTGDGPGSSFKMIDERFTREGLKFGIHNHFFKGRKFEFESADDLLRGIEGHSDTIGVTLDVGHLAILGHDPIEALNKVRSRLHMVHIKDIARQGDDENVMLGTGIAKSAEVIDWLIRNKFAGPVELEYEAGGDPRPGVAKYVEYMRQRTS
ncbi:MAG TPA: sugar phosphate isomerase/epimerase family protein [Pyrinomonadaceae bacterium]|jgi:sugar phosphate isomerase/epimerase|nr:sugar phosphate isomerase/epimerase family protein [Pyrinomonadaceae bacterium]